MSFHYGVPPAHYTKFYDSSSPYSSGEYVQYVPAYDSTPTKRHSRKSSYAESPRVGGWYSPAGESPPYFDAYAHNASPRKDPYVSYDYRSASYSMPATATTKRPKHTRKPSEPIKIVTDDGVRYAEPHVQYIYRDSKPRAHHAKKPSADSYFYFGQDQIYDEQPRRSRARASTGSKPSPKKDRSQQAPPPAPHQATEKDAARAGIPPGYSIKNWDPTEKPIVLLGSVFDANSLGKWIYDWTVYHHGASTPMADMAGDLWLLLIKLAGKMRRAEDCVRRIRNHDSREMMEDFISSGSRLWDKFKTLLKDCEYYMMKAARREGTKTMGKNAGTEFVDSIFGRDRYLESTERIMTNIRMWNMRFDVNCEDILRRPSAA